jgi:hypothetical protein
MNKESVILSVRAIRESWEWLKRLPEIVSPIAGRDAGVETDIRNL